MPQKTILKNMKLHKNAHENNTDFQMGPSMDLNTSQYNNSTIWQKKYKTWIIINTQKIDRKYYLQILLLPLDQYHTKEHFK